MSLYSALNVSPDASDEDIKKSFRELSLAYHPDRQPTAELKQAANMQFHKLHTLYEVLSDPVKRQAYDMYGDAGVEALEGKDELLNKLQMSVHDPGTVKRKVARIIQYQNQQELEARLNLHAAMMMEVRVLCSMFVRLAHLFANVCSCAQWIYLRRSMILRASWHQRYVAMQTLQVLLIDNTVC